MEAGQAFAVDCLEWTRQQPDASVDLVLGSPPYEAARTYGVGFNLRGQAWVDWAVERFLDQVRICRGVVCWAVEGRTSKFRWSATPALLMADLHRAGVHLRKPPAYFRHGIAGSGGPDWWRNDYEFVVCGSRGGRLPWSDNTATGGPPKYPPGGRPSSRKRNGERVKGRDYRPPAIANPGNVIRCKVGRGHMGSDLAHENEAPYPERLAEAFVRCFCPPGGIVFDPFLGSGTTAAVAERFGRRWIGTDIRESQLALTRQRIHETREAMAREKGRVEPCSICA